MSLTLIKPAAPQLFILLCFMLLITACSSIPEIPKLAHIDIKRDRTIQTENAIKPKSTEEIRQAYTDYLKTASVNDTSRINALKRLAEMEFIYSNKLLKEKETTQDNNDEIEDSLYESRLDLTINLLSTSLSDYPGAKNNDVIMYQLAKALDQKGRHQESIDTLTNLAEQYQKSPFYIEAQFRIAEDAFSMQDYSTAEYSYTEVIVAAENDVFYEKSLFKRGWARFKQQFYTDAVDDFLAAVLMHKFDTFEKLNKPEREQFNEYFRAISLAFSYLGGAESLHDYFKDHSNFKYTYHTYSILSDVYLKQERFSDAVETHEQFIKHYPQSENIPYSRLKIIDIWKNSGFTNKIYAAIEKFYVLYNASSPYWQDQNENSSINRAIRRSLKEYIVLMSGYFHNQFQKNTHKADYDKTELWYQRYLKHYSSYAQTDNIYFLYAELLNQNNKLIEALKYYELAAYDNELIIHKDAAYASIILSNMLLEKYPDNKSHARKHIDYALKFAQLYPDDQRTQKLIIHAAELAFKEHEFKNTIDFADIKFNKKPLISDINLANLKAESYFNLKDYTEAESLYSQILLSSQLALRQRLSFDNKLALSIYKQGEQSSQNQKIPQAITHFSRISTIVPQSKIAVTGLYDSIALNMQHKQWDNAISDSKRFQKLYPNHELSADISKKLSVAYLSSNQGIKAAKEFEKISSLSKDTAIKSAALWQAAELYEQQNKLKDAVRSYTEYSKKYIKPYSQYIEALHKLSELSEKTGDLKSTYQWRIRMTKIDNKALNNTKTERTKFLVSLAYLNLARNEKTRFDRLRLSLPLAKSLKKKKKAMQSAVWFFSKASLYKDYDATTEATFTIANIYKDFSKALLESDRPKNLSDEELDQYEILLEDQAFPFEDKAIEFFEINLARIQQGHFNEWIEKSQQHLISLFPVRYNRKPKMDEYTSEIY